MEMPAPASLTIREVVISRLLPTDISNKPPRSLYGVRMELSPDPSARSKFRCAMTRPVPVPENSIPPSPPALLNTISRPARIVAATFGTSTCTVKSWTVIAAGSMLASCLAIGRNCPPSLRRGTCSTTVRAVTPRSGRKIRANKLVISRPASMRISFLNGRLTRSRDNFVISPSSVFKVTEPWPVGTEAIGTLALSNCSASDTDFPVRSAGLTCESLTFGALLSERVQA